MHESLALDNNSINNSLHFNLETIKIGKTEVIDIRASKERLIYKVFPVECELCESVKTNTPFRFRSSHISEKI